jgi:hypothetical protein
MIPLLWPYCPVRNVARDGQQRGNEAKLFANVVPSAASRRWTFAITRTDSTVWSSDMTTTTLGRGCGTASFVADAGRPATSAATAGRTSQRNASRTPIAGLIPALTRIQRQGFVRLRSGRRERAHLVALSH